MQDFSFERRSTSRRSTSPWRLENLEARVTPTATLLQDINVGDATAQDSERAFLSGDSVAVLNGITYFFGQSATAGLALWRSDGTTDGTWIVREHWPYSADAMSNLVVSDGQLYFFTSYLTSEGTKSELWTSDGTADGSVALMVSHQGFNAPGSIQPLGNGVVFLATDSSLNSGTELWFSNGTISGTQLVKDINPGPSSGFVQQLYHVGNHVYFTASDGTNGRQLWRTDGTEAGTIKLTDASADSTFGNFAVVNQSVYFTITLSGGAGEHIWRSDGTVANTVQLPAPLNYPTGFPTNSLSNLMAFNDQLFFAVDEGSIHRVWTTDNTASGTIPITNDFHDAVKMTLFNNELYIASQMNALAGLWKTDGGFGNEQLIYSDIAITGFVGSFGSDLLLSVVSLDRLSLWKTNGTEAGTEILKEIVTASDHRLVQDGVVGDIGFFVEEDLITGQGIIWRTDGTTEGTKRLTELTPASDPQFLTTIGTTTFFAATTFEHGTELWKTDRVSNITEMVADLTTGQGSTQIRSLHEVNGTLYFTADGSTGYERVLWKSDGTASGTTLVSSSSSGLMFESPRYLTEVAGTTYFVASGVETYELWKIDSGNEFEKVYTFTGVLHAPRYLQALKGQLIFTAYMPDEGEELWISDGTTAGTKLLRDINAGNDSSGIRIFDQTGDTLYFSALDGVHGEELWLTDGTLAGTRMVADIFAGPSSGAPIDFKKVGDTVFFSADSFGHGRELWKSDGTTAGTVLVRDLNSDFSSYPTDLTELNGELYFTANYRLFKTDGTYDGTVLLKDFSDPTFPSVPRYLQTIGGELYFVANDRITGNDLWKTNGSVNGTVRITDTAEITSDFTVNGDKIIFVSDDRRFGKELFHVAITRPGTIRFDDVEFSGSETEGSITITLVRENGADGEVSISYETLLTGTATSGGLLANGLDDFVPLSGNITWEDGETGSKTFTITINEDNWNEGIETIPIRLHSPMGGVALIGQSTVLASIAESDSQNTATFTDQDGDRGKITLTGGGTFRFYLHDPDGDGNGPIDRLELFNTTASSILSVTTTINPLLPSGTPDWNNINIGSITAPILKSISATRSHLTGEGIHVSGYLGSVTLRDVLNGADIIAGAGTTGQITRINVGRVGDDSIIQIGNRLESFSAIDVGLSQLSAPSVGSLTTRGVPNWFPTIAGDFAADVFITGTGLLPNRFGITTMAISGSFLSDASIQTPSIQTMTVRGSLAGTVQVTGANMTPLATRSVWNTLTVLGSLEGNLYVQGAMTSITAADMPSGSLNLQNISTINFRGRTGSPSIVGNVNGDISISGANVIPGRIALGSLAVAGNWNDSADLTTPSISTLTVRQNLFGDVNINGQGLPTGAIALRTLAVTDRIDDAAIQVNGVINSINTAAILSGSLSATAINSLVVTGNSKKQIVGNLSANITLDGVNVPLTRNTLGVLRVAGSINSNTISVNGNIGSITANVLENSRLYVGYVLGTNPYEFGPTGSLGRLTTTATTNSMLNTQIVAKSLGTVTIRSVPTDGGSNSIIVDTAIQALRVTNLNYVYNVLNGPTQNFGDSTVSIV